MIAENLFKHIRDNNLTYARICKGEKNLALFTKNETADQLVNRLKSFLKIIDPGQYEIVLKSGDTAPGANAEMYLPVYIDEGFAAGNKTMQGPPMQAPAPQINVEELRKQILSEIRKENEERERANELADLRAQLNEYKKPETRLAGVAMEILNRLPGTSKVIQTLGGNLIPAHLNGTPDENITEVELSEDDENKLNEAESILLHFLTPAQLLQLAHKVKADPGLITTLKNFNLI